MVKTGLLVTRMTGAASPVQVLLSPIEGTSSWHKYFVIRDASKQFEIQL